MKKLALLFTLTLLGSITLTSQPCLTEGITFSIQAQIDNFQTIHPNCTEIEGFVSIGYSQITNLNGLSVLTSIGDSLYINAPHLNSIEGFGNITLIGGSIWIVNCDSLTSLSGLENITSIEGDLFIGEYSSPYQIWGNPSLTSLMALNNVTSINGDLMIAGNDAMYNLSGLDNLTSIGGDLIINGNDALNSISQLENLTYINGNLKIGDYMLYNHGGNKSLVNLTGLDNLDFITGNLEISCNYVLTSLTGLENIAWIGGDLSIDMNHALTSLAGLDNINESSITSLHIGKNDNLAYCHILSVCNYIAAPGGTIEIHVNAPGCNSQEEVEEACETVTIDEVSITGILTASPNPFTTSTSIAFTTTQPEKAELKIYNQLGELIEVIQMNAQPGKQTFTWEANGLPSGIYFIRVQAGNQLITRKMIKL